jgi:hypothetical protein
MVVLTVPRDKVTAEFLKHAGGFCTDGRRLFEVVAVSKDPNEAKVCVEDCWAPCGYPLAFEREALLKMRVVRWPAELA